MVFAFDYEYIVILYAPPVVQLELGFSFTAELKVCIKCNVEGLLSPVFVMARDLFCTFLAQVGV